LNDNELSHDRCSELLSAFAAGELDSEETVRVESHVRDCVECAAELRAVMALRAGDEPLTELERARLRRGISASFGDVIAPERAPSRLKARLTAALGAAALLAIFGVAVVSLGTGGGDSDSGAALSEGDGGGGQVRGRAGEEDTNQAVADAAAPAPPRPTYQRNAGRLSTKKLRNLGEDSDALAAFESAYTVADATELRDRYISAVAGQADAPVDDLIVACAREVYEQQPYAALLAYAGEGKLDGRDALVLGFAWTDQASGPLDRFMLWTWSLSSCDEVIDYRSGEIRPRK
jgi:hypothetical protein